MTESAQNPEYEEAIEATESEIPRENALENSVDVKPEVKSSAETDFATNTLSAVVPPYCENNDDAFSCDVEQQASSPSDKKSRRVSFPVDERVVSGFMDPPTPWHDALSCSTEDLVNAYLKACEKHGVRPIALLLHQLQAINDFCDRNETLTLKGEKLDHKHCETLEEVLRRVQFRLIDLEATHLDDECAIAIFDMVEYYESATKVNIAFNRNIGPRGMQACSRMIKKTPCLEYLDARNCNVTEQVMPMLGRSLKMGSVLTTLHLENCSLSGRTLMILVAAVKMNETLKELFLADNRLMPSDGIQLGNMLKFNHKLNLLDVRNNHLQDTGTQHLCEGLYEQNLDTGLGTLVLWNNQITYQSMPDLAKTLIPTNLETLNLGHNSITNEGIHRIKDGLLQNKSLKRLGLQACKITCEGSVALAEFIADSKHLLRVDLRENDVKTGGLMALSLALKVSESVTRVDLDKEPKKESGVKDYVEQQKRLLQDINNYMQRNRDLARVRQEELERQKEIEDNAAKEVQEAPKPPEEGAEEDSASAAVCGSPNRSALHLNLPNAIRTLQLESPAFVPQAQMVYVPPPTVKEEVVMSLEDAEAYLNAQHQHQHSSDFPPSPVTSMDGKPFLAPVPEYGALSMISSDGASNNLQVTAPTFNAPASPKTRSKFTVHKVAETMIAGSQTKNEADTAGICSASTKNSKEEANKSIRDTAESSNIQGLNEASMSDDSSQSTTVSEPCDSAGDLEAVSPAGSDEIASDISVPVSKFYSSIKTDDASIMNSSDTTLPCVLPSDSDSQSPNIPQVAASESVEQPNNNNCKIADDTNDLVNSAAGDQQKDNDSPASAQLSDVANTAEMGNIPELLETAAPENVTDTAQAMGKSLQLEEDASSTASQECTDAAAVAADEQTADAQENNTKPLPDVAEQPELVDCNLDFLDIDAEEKPRSTSPNGVRAELTEVFGHLEKPKDLVEALAELDISTKNAEVEDDFEQEIRRMVAEATDSDVFTAGPLSGSGALEENLLEASQDP